MTNLERRLIDDLTEMATPINFADLERRGVLRHHRGKCWYLLLKPEALPAYAWKQVAEAGQGRVGDRLVPRLKFRTSTKKDEALLAKVNRAFSRRDMQPEVVSRFD